MQKRLLIVFILGFSSGLPLALLTSTLQAWFATAGMSVMATGMLSLLGLPYLYKLTWAPILDRYTLFFIGKRRSWILVTQALLLLGFNALSCFSPLTSPKLIAGLAFILASISATQDTAIDAHRTEYLPKEEHAIGASLATLGYRIALLVGGGIALIIAQYSNWTVTYRVMGVLMLIGMAAIILSKEPLGSEEAQHSSLFMSWLAPIKELFSRNGIFPLCLFIFFYKLGEAFTTSTSGIVMPFLIQGLGFSLDTIAYVNKILGVGAIVVGGVLAGVLLLRLSLYRALFWFGLIQALTNALFIWLASVGNNLSLLSVAVICDNFAAGLGTTALVALIMRTVDKRYTATQFAILVAISTLPRIFSGPVAASIQQVVGWVGLYQISFILALLFIPFLSLIKRLRCI